MSTGTITGSVAVAASGTGYLQFTADEVIGFVGAYYGDDATSALNLQHTVAGYKNVLRGIDPRTGKRHFWNCMRTALTYVFHAAASGTMTVTGSTTVTDATNKPFTESMIGQTIVSTNGSYVISAYTSTSVVTVSTDASADTGETFTINSSGYYYLPSSYAGMVDKPVFAYSSTGNRYDLEECSPDVIRAELRDNNDTGYMRKWATEAISFTATTGQRYRFLVAPVPIEDMTVGLRIKTRAEDPTAGTGEYFLGGDILDMAIRDAALADAELIHTGGQGPMAAAADKSLAAAIDGDKELVTSSSGTEQIREGGYDPTAR